MPDRSPRRVFVTGGAGYLGFRVARALLDDEAEVTVLVRPDSADVLGPLRGQVRQVQGDVWNPASLRGRARGHSTVIHLVGGVRPDPARGLTFRHLNFISARNVIQMAINDGVHHVVLLSAAAAPIGVSGEYIESKRDAERYLQKAGMDWTIVRAPPLFVPGQRRSLIYMLIAMLYRVPLLGMPLARYAPLAADTAARGLASLALSTEAGHNRIIGPRRLRRIGRLSERRHAVLPAAVREEDRDPFIDEPPFGWLPPR